MLGSDHVCLVFLGFKCTIFLPVSQKNVMTNIVRHAVAHVKPFPTFSQRLK